MRIVDVSAIQRIELTLAGDGIDLHPGLGGTGALSLRQAPSRRPAVLLGDRDHRHRLFCFRDRPALAERRPRGVGLLRHRRLLGLPDHAVSEDRRADLRVLAGKPRARPARRGALMRTQPDFQTLLYRTAGPVATITLNRPEQLNTIVPPMPDEIEAAIGLAERDPEIKVIVLRGAGPGLLRRLRLRRRVPALGRGHDDRRAMGSRQGLRDGQRPRDRADAVSSWPSGGRPSR